MPPRRTTKPAPAPAPEPETPQTVEETAEDGPIVLATRPADSKPVEYVEIFNIDGRSFGLDKARTSGHVINALWVLRDSPDMMTMGLDFIHRILGKDALDALLAYPDLDFTVISRIVNLIQKTVKGAQEEPGKP